MNRKIKSTNVLRPESLVCRIVVEVDRLCEEAITEEGLQVEQLDLVAHRLHLPEPLHR